jgi:hypothetical protein
MHALSSPNGFKVEIRERRELEKEEIGYGVANEDLVPQRFLSRSM